MRKLKRGKAFWGLFLVILYAVILSVPVKAERIPAAEGAKSTNRGSQNYGTYGKTIKSYLYTNEDQTLTRVELTTKSLIFEKYNKNYKLIKKGSIKKELPLFGGFYAGKDANYVVFGQKNTEENDKKEVFRVVKYTKDFKRVASCKLSDCNTTVPFDFGSLRFAESGNMLYIRTCHEMYTSSDGLNHQANLMMAVDTGNMTITDSFSSVANLGVGYVSHSFNQFLQVDGQDLLAVDHGDAYPRSVVLIKYNQPAGSPSFLQTKCTYVDLLKFPGAIGKNMTGGSVGGFEVSDTSYLAAGNYENKSANANRNIFLSITPKGELEEGNTRLVYLTNYGKKENINVSTPHLVKINSNQFMILWEVETYGGNSSSKTYYVVVDDNGKKLTNIQKFSGRLSDCKPVVYKNKVLWYYTDNSAPVFCEIPADGSKPKENPVTGEQYTIGDITYEITKRTAKTKNVAVTGIKENTKATITIPDAVTIMGEKYFVTEVNGGVFFLCNQVKKIVFGRNISKLDCLFFPYSNKIKIIDIISTKLKTVDQAAFMNLSDQAVIKVPKSKLSAYKKLLKGKGQGSCVKIVSRT